MRQELLDAGLEKENVEEFLGSLQRSTLARPDAGLTEFRAFCRRVEVNKEEVCSKYRSLLKGSRA